MSRVRAKEVYTDMVVVNDVRVRDSIVGLGEAVDDGSLPGSKIAEGSLHGSKLAPNTVGSNELADGSVTAQKLGIVLVSGSVATIGVKSITEEKIADDAVTTAKIRDGAVTRLKLGEGAVGGGNIADGVVDASKIAPLAVSEGKLASGAVSASKIQGGAVHGSKIVAEAVQSHHIADSAVRTNHIYFQSDDASASSAPAFHANIAGEFTLPEGVVEVSLDLGPQFNGLTVAKLACLIADGADMVGSFEMRVTLKHQVGIDVAQVYKQVVTDLDLSPGMALPDGPIAEVYNDTGDPRLRIRARVTYPGSGTVAVRFVASGTIDKLVF